MSNSTTVQSWWFHFAVAFVIVFPGLIAASNGSITQLAEAGNLTCSKDHPPNSRDLDHIQLGENWLPNITTSAYLADRYHLMDRFLTSNCDSPNGGVCGTMDWADLISSVDPNIQAIGAKDNSDANGTQGVGDVYWTVSYYCPEEDACAQHNLVTLFSNILNKVMPGTSTSVIQAMANWGLALPPSYPNGPGDPWGVPSYRGNGAVLQMLVPTRGRITAR